MRGAVQSAIVVLAMVYASKEWPSSNGQNNC